MIAAAVGGFLLPLVGFIGALAFFSRGDMRSARIVGLAALAGVIAYAILFGVV